MSDISLPLIVHLDDIKIREMVGCGSFSSVYRVSFRDENGSFSNSLQTLIREHSSSSLQEKCVLNALEDDENLYENDTTSECASESADISLPESLPVHSVENILKSSSQHFKCVLKRLYIEQFSCSGAMEIALQGVRFEAKLLTELVPPHDHIVRVYGISDSLYEPKGNCFIILEYLESTLEKSLSRWRCEKRHRTMNRWKELQTFLHSSLKRRQNTDLDSDQVRAIRIGLAIAKAMQHLHRYHILYRDLKPSNVGIDTSGRIRIFDFDLSRECEARPNASGANPKSDRLHTQCVGSIRYMSPECATSTDYDYSSDVHSFAIVLWETLTLQRAFAKARDHIHFYKLVFQRNMRPSLRTVSCPRLTSLLRVCWNPNPNFRPTFSSIVVEMTLMQSRSPKQT
jgi:serine/threonine protein kinase